MMSQARRKPEIDDPARLQALRDTALRYRMMVRATRSVVWDWDIASGRVEWDGPGAELLRFEPGEMGATFGWWYQRLHPDERQPLIASLDAALDGVDATWSYEHRFQRGDGAWATVLDCCCIVRDPGGRAVRVIGSMSDVSERKRQEVTQRLLAAAGPVLNESLHRDTALVRLAALAVPALADCCLVDVVADDGALRRVALAHAEPAREAELRAQNAEPGDDSLVAQVVRAGHPVLTADVAAGEPGDAHARLPVEGVEVRSFMVVPLGAHDRVLGAITLATAESGRRYGPADLLAAQDLAHRAALAVEHARLYADAREAIRARDEILGVISHDLRNPLNTMRLTTALLLDQVQDRRADTVQKLEMLQRACMQMDRMVQDLLDVSSLEAGRLLLSTSEREVAALVGEADALLRPLAEQKSIDLECTVQDGLPRVRLDGDRVLRVISNLVGNAIKFTPEGGRVSLRVERGDGCVRFAVADTGPGIPPELLPHVFERYWQSRPGDRRGTGLGLHIARGIVQAHGGRIQAESPPGSGAVVTFTLPATPAAGA